MCIRNRLGAIRNCQLPITLEVIANDPITKYFTKKVMGNAPPITHCYFGTLVMELVVGNKSTWLPPLVIGYQLLFQIFFKKVSE